MNTLRLTWLGGVLLVLSACAGSGRTSSDGVSDADAAIANMNLGAGYLQQGRADLAIERLERALAQNPRLVQAHSTLAIAYSQIGDLEQAESHYRRAVELAPSSGASANAYAAFLCQQGRWTEAEPFFRRAAEDSDYTTPEVALTNAGVCARDAGSNDRAADNFRAALARNPTYADALLNLMDLSYQARNFLQTRAFVQRYLAAHAPAAPVLWICFNAERELANAEASDRCAAQLRAGFRGTPELDALENLQRGNGR
jgi:type IV pilus assembly protein PilF